MSVFAIDFSKYVFKFRDRVGLRVYFSMNDEVGASCLRLQELKSLE